MSKHLDGITEDSDTLFAEKLRERLPKLTTKDIEAICEAVSETCKHCWDSDIGCQCWNDE